MALLYLSQTNHFSEFGNQKKINLRLCKQETIFTRPPHVTVSDHTDISTLASASREQYNQ